MVFQDFSSLYIFERIAHLLSFKEAASSLNLTQSALSHRIRKLEKDLGFQLFERQTRRIALTLEGERLYHVIAHHFSAVKNEIDGIQNQALHGKLEIGSTPTFAQYWLAPRLSSFYRAYPELDLHIRSKGSRVNFSLYPADLWIDYGDGNYPNLTVTPLMDEVLMPVCTQQYADTMGLIDHPERLTECLLLHDVESIDQNDPKSEWRGWLEQEGLRVDTCHHHYSFTHYDTAIIAARSGLGIAMGRYQLAKSLVERGDLIFPFDAAYSQGLGYYVIHRNDMAEFPRIKAFCQWLSTQR